MSRFYVVAPDIYKPRAYHAVKIDNWVYTTGLIGMTMEGQLPQDFDSQCHQLWDNILSVLKAAGAELEHIVNSVTYHTDPNNLNMGTKIRSKYVQGCIPPIGVLTVVKALASPDLLLEIQLTAMIG